MKKAAICRQARLRSVDKPSDAYEFDYLNLHPREGMFLWTGPAVRINPDGTKVKLDAMYGKVEITKHGLVLHLN